MLRKEFKHSKTMSLLSMSGIAAIALTACASGTEGDANAPDTQSVHAGMVFNPDIPMIACGLEEMTEDPQLEELGIQVTYTDSGQLGTESEMLEQVAAGELDMAISLDSMLATTYGIPELEMFEAYYLYDSIEDLSTVRATETAQELYARLPEEAGVHAVGDPWLYGERHVFGNQPVSSSEDFDNMSFRVPETDISLSSATALGASPMSVSYSELYMSLQQGVVDSGEAPLAVIQSESLHEPSTHISLTGHLLSASVPVINNDLWESFSAEQQEGFTAAMNAAAARVGECVAEQDASALEEFEASSDIEVVDQVDRDELRNKVEESYRTDFSWSEDYVQLLDDLR